MRQTSSISDLQLSNNKETTAPILFLPSTADTTFEALCLININSAAFPPKYFPTSAIALAWAKKLLGFVISAFWRLLSLWALLNQTQNQQDHMLKWRKKQDCSGHAETICFLPVRFLTLILHKKKFKFLMQTYVHLVLRHPSQKHRHVPVQ